MKNRIVTYSFFAAALLTCAAFGPAWSAEHPGGAEHPGMDENKSAAAAPAEKKSEAAGTQTVSGEILDMSCYADHGAKGTKHATCAVKCFEGGSPAGLLRSDGSILLLVENHSKSKAYQEMRKLGGQNVTVTGTEKETGGLKTLSVDKVEKSK